MVTDKHYMPSMIGSKSFSMKNETLHLNAGFNNIKHILTNQSSTPYIHTSYGEERALGSTTGGRRELPPHS
jgi:hypothetical protein